MLMSDYDDHLPTKDQLPADKTVDDLLRNYVADPNIFGAPGGAAFFSLLFPTGRTLGSIPRPSDTPMGFLAWPAGYMAVVFCDGGARMFTDAEWDRFVADAKANGNWSPDW